VPVLFEVLCEWSTEDTGAEAASRNSVGEEDHRATITQRAADSFEHSTACTRTGTPDRAAVYQIPHQYRVQRLLAGHSSRFSLQDCLPVDARHTGVVLEERLSLRAQAEKNRLQTQQQLIEQRQQLQPLIEQQQQTISIAQNGPVRSSRNRPQLIDTSCRITGALQHFKILFADLKQCTAQRTDSLSRFHTHVSIEKQSHALEESVRVDRSGPVALKRISKNNRNRNHHHHHESRRIDRQQNTPKQTQRLPPVLQQRRHTTVMFCYR
jgi:hypothetical protein